MFYKNKFLFITWNTSNKNYFISKEHHYILIILRVRSYIYLPAMALLLISICNLI